MARTEDFDQAVFMTLLAAYVELVRELQQSGHLDAHKLADRLQKVANRFEGRDERKWSLKMLGMMAEILGETGEAANGQR